MDVNLSQEIFAIQQGENFIIYAPFQGAAVLCNASMLNFLQDLLNGNEVALSNPAYAEVLSSLHEAGLLVDHNGLERESDLLVSESMGLGFSPTRATLL